MVKFYSYLSARIGFDSARPMRGNQSRENRHGNENGGGAERNGRVVALHALQFEFQASRLHPYMPRISMLPPLVSAVSRPPPPLIVPTARVLRISRVSKAKFSTPTLPPLVEALMFELGGAIDAHANAAAGRVEKTPRSPSDRRSRP